MSRSSAPTSRFAKRSSRPVENSCPTLGAPVGDGGWVEIESKRQNRLAYPVLARYDLPTTTVPHYGMCLGVGETCGRGVQEAYDPLSPWAQGEVRDLADAAGCPVGLSGSRLVGLIRAGSDIDVVLYGRVEWRARGS